jgi:DNA-directed RNA polymerase subunit RPC12/RpoP
MFTENDAQKIKQWMELVNEMIDGLIKDVRITNHLPDEYKRKQRLLHQITNDISVAAAKTQTTHIYTCRKCSKGFDEYERILTDYHKREFDYACPHCNSCDFGKTSGMEPMLSQK